MNGINRLPLVEELHTKLTPVDLFEFFRSGPFHFFLDSASKYNREGRRKV